MRQKRQSSTPGTSGIGREDSMGGVPVEPGAGPVSATGPMETPPRTNWTKKYSFWYTGAAAGRHSSNLEAPAPESNEANQSGRVRFTLSPADRAGAGRPADDRRCRGA